MPSINPSATNVRIPSHPNKPQPSPARATHFGMQPNTQPAPASHQASCWSALGAWFRNLFRRNGTSAPVTPMQPEVREASSLLSHDDKKPVISYDALSEIPLGLERPLLRRQNSGPVEVPLHFEDNVKRIPIHELAAQWRLEQDRARTGLDVPFTPHAVTEEKLEKQRLYSGKL
jgi:hypothetical protein